MCFPMCRVDLMSAVNVAWNGESLLDHINWDTSMIFTILDRSQRAFSQILS